MFPKTLSYYSTSHPITPTILLPRAIDTQPPLPPLVYKFEQSLEDSSITSSIEDVGHDIDPITSLIVSKF